MFTPVGFERFRLANTTFVPAITSEGSTPSEFRIQKSAEAIAMFPRLRDHLLFKNVLQLVGEDIGSLAMTALVGAPTRLVGISAHRGSDDALQEFARLRGMEDRLVLHQGVPLDDQDALARIAADDFDTGGPEVVVDDFSDRLSTGLTVFETLFPLLTPGGSYIIERWCWDHFILEGFVRSIDPSDVEAVEDARSTALEHTRNQKGEVLEKLLPRLVAMARTRPEVVASVTASRHFLVVRRGVGRLTPAELPSLV